MDYFCLRRTTCVNKFIVQVVFAILDYTKEIHKYVAPHYTNWVHIINNNFIKNENEQP